MGDLEQPIHPNADLWPVGGRAQKEPTQARENVQSPHTHSCLWTLHTIVIMNVIGELPLDFYSTHARTHAQLERVISAALAGLKLEGTDPGSRG